MSPRAHVLICLRFFSRLPLPSTRREIELGPGGLAAAVRWVPVAGAIIGIIPGLVLVFLAAIGLPPVLAAPLAIGALMIATGALHEDGLADCADGFGGGRTRARKLEIMRDSRIGTFGAGAIALSLYVRAASLGLIATRSPGLAAGIVIATAGLSRTACLLPLFLLPPARTDGLGIIAGRPTRAGFATAVAIAIGLSLISLPLGAGPATLALSIVLAFGGALAICVLAWRQIGGQTGDVAGAAQQAAELGMMLILAGAP